MEKKVIKEVPVKDLVKINLIPTANWMITTAFIEAEDSELFMDKSFVPTFINMQQVLACGPRVEGVHRGDWVYIDMDRFNKTVKKKSTIRAGVGGEEMVSEQLVPPIFMAPGDPNAYFKISDREIEGVIVDPYSIGQTYMTVEDYVEKQEQLEAEIKAKKDAHDKHIRELREKNLAAI